MTNPPKKSSGARSRLLKQSVMDFRSGFTPLEIYTFLKRRVRHPPQFSLAPQRVSSSASLMGFTLVELLVVIAMFGIITTIVAVSLQGARERAKEVRVRMEMAQILRAAELVLNTYGYYPNDSRGSITCPKNIVVDSSSGKTFGAFIDLCEDPWGQPYVWHNICQDGNIRKSDGSNPTCPPFSDQNPGPIGILSSYSNETIEECGNDDVCNGDRNHPITNWSTTSGSSLSSPQCSDDVDNDGDLKIDYPSDPGCSDASDTSEVDPVSPQCSDGNDNDGDFKIDFPSDPGCTDALDNNEVDPPPLSCVDAISNCSGFPIITSCEGRSGCTWQSGCSGTPSVCSIYSSSASCTGAGCGWNTAVCSGTAVACSTITVKTTCLTQTGCTWRNSPLPRCYNNHNACSTYTQAQCPGQLNCSWSAANCSGAPSPCSSYSSSASCTGAACTWASGICTGTATSCSTYSTEGVCTAQSGCSWQ